MPINRLLMFSLSLWLLLFSFLNRPMCVTIIFQRLPAVLSRIGIILASPLVSKPITILDLETFHAIVVHPYFMTNDQIIPFFGPCVP